jgi:1,4-dihydroxy-2-naphthoate octaprenyltransferase
LSLFAIAGVVGAYLVATRGWFIIFLAVFGFLSGYFYTTHLATTGLGELFVVLNFGPLLAVGSFYVQTQVLAIEPFIAALPLGLLVGAILWINEIPDYTADKSVGKNTAVVRLGRRKAAGVYAYLMISAFVLIVAGAISRILPITSLISLLALQPALKAIDIARRNYDSRELRPANALTITVHLLTGLLLVASYFLQRLLPA